MRPGAADRAGIGSDRAKLESQAREYARIRVEHIPIFALEVGVAPVKRIAVLHHELAPAHDTEARPALVAEFGLDLIEVHGQLPVALDLVARDVGDDLFGGRLDHEVAFVPVLQAQ